MSLEAKSIHELRGVAQAVGVKFAWEWDKPKLLRKITAKCNPENWKPPKRSDDPKLDSPYAPTQEKIIEATENLRKLGLVITFPTPDTWQMNWDRREDSGSMTLPLHVIYNCAKELMR